MKKIIFSIISFFSFLLISNAEVYDVAKVTIDHHLTGINGKVGEANLDNSAYEVYSEGQLLFVSRNLVFYLPKYHDYVIKDVSQNYGVHNTIDMTLTNLKKDCVLNFDKPALSKTYILDIKDDLTYKIYLKKDNDLYYTFDKRYGQITLPYGTYYIKNDKDEIVKEVTVNNEEEETLTLGEKQEEEIPQDKEDKEKEPVKPSSSEESKPSGGNKESELTEEKEPANTVLQEEVKEDTVPKEDSSLEKDNVNNIVVASSNIANPQTGDNIILTMSLFILASIMIIISKKMFFKKCI